MIERRPLKNDYILVNNYGCWVENAKKKDSITVHSDKEVPLPNEMVFQREGIRWDQAREVWRADWEGADHV